MLLDVREPMEWRVNRIEGARLVPLQELPQRTGELGPEDEIVVYCQVGERSAWAVQFLRGRGFGKARNLEGGIEAWIDRVDPTLPRG